MAELDINEQNFEQEVVSSDVPVLLDFWAPWCGPCKMLMPVVEELAKEYDGKIKVGKVNTDENMSLSSKFQITSIPCLIIFIHGNRRNMSILNLIPFFSTHLLFYNLRICNNKFTIFFRC